MVIYHELFIYAIDSQNFPDNIIREVKKMVPGNRNASKKIEKKLDAREKSTEKKHLRQP